MPDVNRNSEARDEIPSGAVTPATYPASAPSILLDYSAISVLDRAVRSSVGLVRTRIIEPRRRRARFRAEIGYLRGMSDYQLRDIGLSRSDIAAAACGKVEHPVSRVIGQDGSLPPRRRKLRLRPAGASTVSTTGTRERRQRSVAERFPRGR